MVRNKIINVRGRQIILIFSKANEYILLTEMVRYQDAECTY